MDLTLNDFFNNNINELIFCTNDENETQNFAYNFAQYLKKCDVVVLTGELGSGKTVFVNGIAKYFNIESEVSSPTFTIVNEYLTNTTNIYHFDVYRLKDEYEFENTIGTDYFSNGICIIEWGEIIKNILPPHTIFIDISKSGSNTRQFKIRRNK